MTSVCIGIPVHAEPERLRQTLEQLRPQVRPDVKLILLPDGADEPTQTALAALRAVPQWATAEPLGPPACFNRLAAASDADVVVLLESGAIPGQHWLTCLLSALDADPRNGLAGPSTNRSWNEQAAFPNGGDSPAAIAATAYQAMRMHRRQTRTLEPLYSLADFCYAVRREVIDAIGGADEAYGLGPCWEMDYNIRAARAGFRGVWACSAYVWRPPFTQRRAHEETARFEVSKRLYQDRFCALRLRRERTDYEAHCRGDACPHYAPADLIALRRPLPEAPDPSPTAAWPGALPRIEPAAADRMPLVSCIMPTHDRRRFLPQAIAGFQRQDYANLELIVVDDGSDPIADCLPGDARIRYVRLDARRSIGAKRNLACTQAAGEIIVHWDDDDWYPAWRISDQVRALRDRGASVCGSSQLYYLDEESGSAWRYSCTGQRKPWVAGNTLAYRRERWARKPFPDLQVGEDTKFVWGTSPREVADLADPALCIATLHSGNSAEKSTRGPNWRQVPIAELLLLRDAPIGAALPPLVSCIMPTRDRRPFVELALAHFYAQDYPSKELVIVDDGRQALDDLVEGMSDVRIVRLPTPVSIGAKRNIACQHAAGEVVVQWDDDDWYSPGRLDAQAAPILGGDADLSGLHSSYVLELASGVFWTCEDWLHRRMFVGNVHGGTLAFRRSVFADGVRYPDANLAEDAAFISQARAAGKRLAPVPNAGTFVYVRHGRNAWRFSAGQFLDPAGWRAIDPPATFPADALPAYRRAAALAGSA